jgi:hypothetical protein
MFEKKLVSDGIVLNAVDDDNYLVVVNHAHSPRIRLEVNCYNEPPETGWSAMGIDLTKEQAKLLINMLEQFTK